MNASTSADRSPGGLTITQQVRWGDMDAMGHVNNVVYFQYCESGRIAYVDRLDTSSFREHERQSLGMVAANLNFRRQMHYPGEVIVETHVTEIGYKSFTVAYRLLDASDRQVVAEGTSVCVWVDYAAGRALPLPEALVDGIAQFEQQPALRDRWVAAVAERTAKTAERKST